MLLTRRRRPDQVAVDPLVHDRHLGTGAGHRHDDGERLADRRRDGVDGLDPGPQPLGDPERSMPGAAMRQWSIATTSCERCRRSPARPSASTANSTRVRQSSPSVVTGDRLDLDVDLEVRQPGHLLAHDVGLERALARQRDVLEVAAAAQPGPGARARRRHPVGRRREHRDGIRAHEALAGAGLGDPGQHPLAGQGVPHEEHLPVVPGDAVPAVGDRGDVDLDLVADREAGARVLGHQPSPRRTSPATGPSIRSSMPCDEASCHGTDETMTPGVNSSRVRSRSALWLCRICSHQWPTTYCGM